MTVKRPYELLSIKIKEGKERRHAGRHNFAVPMRNHLVRYTAIFSLGFVFAMVIYLPQLHMVFFQLEPEAEWDPDLVPGENPFFHLGSVWDHNDEVSARIDRCASLGLLRETANVPRELPPREEARYAAEGCGTKETTVIILASFWFTEAYQGSSATGEGIWAQSAISALNYHGYAYMFGSLGWMNSDMSKTIELWQRYRRNVRLVLADPEQVDVCWNGEVQECRKTEANPDGIEVWRLLSFWYWDNQRNPLGGSFTLSPFPRNENYFLSLSIELTCRRYPFISHSHRPRPPKAYILAKQIHYLDDSAEFAWTIPALVDLQKSLGISVVGGMVNDDENTAATVEMAGLTNLGQLGKIEFYKELASSFVLIGVGRPKISPSPWDGLCMGLPFINPIMEWDEEDPENRTKWVMQSWHMTELNPPYVYSVKAHDTDGLQRAVRAALIHPIGSYIPDNMSFKFVTAKMAEVVEGDWRGRAEDILRERFRVGGGELFDL